MKFNSITTPPIQHDSFNMIAELMLLNTDMSVGSFTWRQEKYKKFWSKTVSCLKKLVGVHDISIDQLAFYVFKCRPVEIDSVEFGKAAIVAKKLFRKFDLQDLVAIYRTNYISYNSNPNWKIEYKTYKRKNLIDFLKELENE